MVVIVTTTTEVPKHEQSSHFNANHDVSPILSDLPLNLPRFFLSLNTREPKPSAVTQLFVTVLEGIHKQCQT